MSCAPRVFLWALLAVTAGLLALDHSSGPADASEQPIGLWFPWEAGTSWRLTNGPHGSTSDGHGHALDFQPADAAGVSCDAQFSSSTWVVAAAGGRVIERSNGLEIDHGNGFRTGYLHVQEKQVTSGRVDAGDRLGKVSCCPEGGFTSACWATAPHLHFYTVFNGARQSIVGINLEGWGMQEDGCFTRGPEEACVMSWLTSGAPSHVPANADVVLILDATGDLATGDPQRARLVAARTYLGVSRPDDRVGIVTYNSKLHGTTPLREVKGKRGMDVALLHRVDSVGASGEADMRLGIRAGCRQLLREGVAETRAAILISDGVHDYRQFGEPEACFRAHNWPLYTLAVGPGGEQTLEQVAGHTGGEFVNGTPASGCDLHRLRMAIGGQQPGVCKTDTALPEKGTRITFEVPEGQGEAVFSGDWLRADVPYAVAKRTAMDMKLVSPSGRIIENGGWASAGVTYEAGQSYTSFAVPSPQPGVWSVRLTGVAGPPEGVSVTVSLTTTVAAPPPPAPAEEPQPEETSAPEESPTETPTETPAIADSASPEESSGSPSVTPTPALSPTRTSTPAPPPPPPTPEPTPEPTPPPTPEPPPPTPDATAPP